MRLFRNWISFRVDMTSSIPGLWFTAGFESVLIMLGFLKSLAFRLEFLWASEAVKITVEWSMPIAQHSVRNTLKTLILPPITLDEWFVFVSS